MYCNYTNKICRVIQVFDDLLQRFDFIFDTKNEFEAGPACGASNEFHKFSNK
jgi:hypothetical protein